MDDGHVVILHGANVSNSQFYPAWTTSAEYQGARVEALVSNDPFNSDSHRLGVRRFQGVHANRDGEPGHVARRHAVKEND